MNKWQKEIKKTLNECEAYPDKVMCHKDGTVSVWRSYFYHHGNTSEKWANTVKDALAKDGFTVTIVGHQDCYNSWPKDSYFKVWIKGAQHD